MLDVHVLQLQVDKIVKDYLYKISSLKKHNYFRNKTDLDIRVNYYRNHGFEMLDKDNVNYNVVKEEMFLEGCTRVFLINPIMKFLLEQHDIKNDWKYGYTFADFNISNREYELGNYLEFIAVLDGKRVGIRYTKASYSANEIYAMDRDYVLLYGKEKVPGFEVIGCIDTLYVLDWSGSTDGEQSKKHTLSQGPMSNSTNISIEAFFEKYFSKIEYDVVISKAQNAIAKAKKIIALRAIPQLLPDNMLLFKKMVLEDFNEDNVSKFVYEFQNDNHICGFSESDIDIIKNVFLNKYRNALIGKSDFAKSFITSEYLFRTIIDGLSIDYTSIIVGYLKSVEQLLFLLYVTAFEGNSRMEYWDRCNRIDRFDTNNNRFRYDPYNLEKCWMQEKYFHKIKTGKKAPEFGELTRFLRYFDKMWRISEAGKEYVYECLEDFREFCRNSHFHKDNIDASEYDVVKRIRNNTQVCLYYLLGGFYFLDNSTYGIELMGIIDYDFESLYELVRQRVTRWFDAKFDDGSQSLIYYLNDDQNVEYSGSGELENACLRFVKIGINKEDACAAEVNNLIKNESFINEHSFYISRNKMPVEMKPILIRGKR